MGGKVSSLVFQPPAKPSHLNSTKYILLPTAKGTMIPAFYFDRSAHLTILVSHGNAEDLGKCCLWGVWCGVCDRCGVCQIRGQSDRRWPALVHSTHPPIHPNSHALS